MSNPILRHNIDTFFEYFQNGTLSLDSWSGWFKSHRLTFSPEVFSALDKPWINETSKLMACASNYPMEIIDFSLKAEKTMGKCPKIIPKIWTDSEKKYGKSLTEWYQSCFSRSSDVNNGLRESKSLSERAKEVVTFFDSHQRPLGENTTLIRGTNFLKNVRPGDIISDKGYMSCATKEGLIENIRDIGRPLAKFNNFLIIKVPGTKKMFVPYDWTRYDSMGERILPRNTKLKVISIHPLTDYGSAGTGYGLIEGRKAIICEII